MRISCKRDCFEFAIFFGSNSFTFLLKEKKETNLPAGRQGKFKANQNLTRLAVPARLLHRNALITLWPLA